MLNACADGKVINLLAFVARRGGRGGQIMMMTMARSMGRVMGIMIMIRNMTMGIVLSMNLRKILMTRFA